LAPQGYETVADLVAAGVTATTFGALVAAPPHTKSVLCDDFT
jgi:hypothetical protein